ncbi:MAG TPA: beta-ribofuranosylaminobenzene 5'-phosphate synthase family protein [Candidatus Limnocylindrales bacterium]|nr:beta-ribofuranosylaminobenzene 5'-phosphate synthase family protein [Candidatus Limnocylindrales bacterium]
MKVYVKASARLHLGLIDLRGELGRLWGGLGVGVNCPNVILQAEKSRSLSVWGENSELVRPFVELFLKKYNVEPKVAVNVKRTIPQHVGLGSGTQLALATAVALARIFDINASVQELAAAVGRGKVSGVGTAVFEKGGFVVEGGVKIRNDKSILPHSFPPVIFQDSFPDDWFFTVAIPNVERGLSGEVEANAFSSLPPMSTEQAGRLSRLILMSLLPALKEKDIKTFGAALTQIQNIVGDCFASVQGGRFASSPSGECIAYMLKHGAFGAGQSSWGPTVYGLVEGEKQAEKLAVEVQGFLQKSSGGQAFCTAANNRGAYIKITP